MPTYHIPEGVVVEVTGPAKLTTVVSGSAGFPEPPVPPELLSGESLAAAAAFKDKAMKQPEE